MLDDKICEMREKLNKSIITGEDYSIIYSLSLQLDELIVEFYRRANILKPSNMSETTNIERGTTKERITLVM